MQQLKPFAVTLDPATSLINHTGSWRTERPIYLHRLPPCNNACPAGENIQVWLALAEEGKYEEAWRQIMDDNPFPAVMGRACYHPCETSCNRQYLDEPVGINSVERFLGDQALVQEWKMEAGAPTWKRVLIIGGGPGGLACAYHLRRFGHAVTVYEASPKAGGMIRYGIPKYRMPREKLTAEIARIEAMGVEIKCNTRVDDILAAKTEGQFDAVFLATGAQLPRYAQIEVAEGSVPVLNALDVLRDAELDNPSKLHGRVVIYGGGNTAMDVARTAIRYGVRKATVVVYEAREHMPAHKFEIHEALEEGAELLNLRAIHKVEGYTLHLEKMAPTNERTPRPTGEFETLEADVVVQAIGQGVELDFLKNLPGLEIKDGVIQVDEGMYTGIEGLFAGGDMVPSIRTVTASIGHGKRAARYINAYLHSTEYKPPLRHELAKFEYLEPWYYSDAPRSHRPRLDVVRRTSGFAEVVGNLDEETAAYEARRCMSCGNCFECDNCYGVCPDNAITKLGPGKGFEFKYDYCKGCGLCESECPCGAIKMIPEEI
jgi:NADPH-dependent glutamate synthase beta subunit-like oxidoreductase